MLHFPELVTRLVVEIYGGRRKMMNQPGRTEEPFQRRSQFKWPAPHPQFPPGPIELLPLFPEVDDSRRPDTQLPQPEVPRTRQKNRGKMRQTPSVRQKKRLPRRRKLRRLLVIVSIMSIMGSLLCFQLNGQFGAQFADVMRAVFGPQITAQVESWFLGVSDTTHRVQYQLSGQQPNVPWTIPHVHKPIPS